jgi:RND family efflux transporter MFP subunit
VLNPETCNKIDLKMTVCKLLLTVWKMIRINQRVRRCINTGIWHLQRRLRSCFDGPDFAAESRHGVAGILWGIMVIVVISGLFSPDRLHAQENLVVQRAKRNITLTGYTRSQTAVTLSSEVAGRILEINYDVGQVVGELPFLDIDPTFIDLQIDSTRQTLKQLKITLNKRRSRVDYLDKEFQRIEKLFRRGSSPESRRDSFQEDLDQARYDRQTTAVEIAIVRTRLQELMERKSRHTISAPAGWIVVAKLVEEGELVTVNTPVARVADYGSLVVPLSVSARELDAIQKLSPEFAVRLDGRTARAAINWINPEFDEKTRKLAIELILRSYPGPRRGGLVCSLALKTAAEGLWVPKQTVVSRYDNPRVFLEADGTEVKVLVLGQTRDHLIIAEDPRLPPGTRLKPPASSQPQSSQDMAR